MVSTIASVNIQPFLNILNPWHISSLIAAGILGLISKHVTTTSSFKTGENFFFRFKYFVIYSQLCPEWMQ